MPITSPGPGRGRKLIDRAAAGRCLQAVIDGDEAAFRASAPLMGRSREPIRAIIHAAVDHDSVPMLCLAHELLARIPPEQSLCCRVHSYEMAAKLAELGHIDPGQSIGYYWYYPHQVVAYDLPPDVPFDQRLRIRALYLCLYLLGDRERLSQWNLEEWLCVLVQGDVPELLGRVLDAAGTREADRLALSGVVDAMGDWEHYGHCGRLGEMLALVVRRIGALDEGLARTLLFTPLDLKTARLVVDLGVSPEVRNDRGELPYQHFEGLRREALKRQSRQRRNKDQGWGELAARCQELSAFYRDLHFKAHPEELERLMAGRHFAQAEIKMDELTPLISPSGRLSLSYRGKPYEATSRFMDSLAASLRFSLNIFTYFTHEEVFRRIGERFSDYTFHVTVDVRSNQFLGISRQVPEVYPDAAIRELQKGQLLKSSAYIDGTFYAEYEYDGERTLVRLGEGCSYRLRYLLAYPVDGRSPMRVLIGARRLEDDATFYLDDKRFITTITSKVSARQGLIEGINSFSNPYGYALLRERLQAAYQTRISVSEYLEAQEAIDRALPDGVDRQRLKEGLDAVAGDPCAHYGITSLAVINKPFRPKLPLNCCVIDALNFLAAIASGEEMGIDGIFRIYSALGRKLAAEYDLEGIFSREPPAARARQGVA
ncbi:MAG: hypothetical protein K6A65_05270 [Succinivibrionaceae bacterium]|nr:hypothetical protein [Succinivibrionaceae bacterium]